MQTPTIDDFPDDDRVTAPRERARNLLPGIIQQVKMALTKQDIDLEIFLIIPASGDAIVTFGTVADPDDTLWNRVSEIVCSIVRDTVGLDRVGTRTVTCAATTNQEISPADHRAVSLPILAPLPIFDAGADQ